MSDARNFELRFSILNKDLPPSELVKMSSEDLAPSSLKNRRIELKDKYFKEQVLMKEDMKIIAKTHKGESLLTVDDTADKIFTASDIVSLHREKNDDNISIEKTQGDLNSDIDIVPDTTSNFYKTVISPKNTSSSGLIDLSKNTTLTKQTSQISVKSLNKTKTIPSIKYKNLTQEQILFYNQLEEYSREAIIKKINEKLKSYLTESTIKEIENLREFNK